MIPSGATKPDNWNEWGPDLIFLRIPTEHVGAIEKYRVFYNLSVDRSTTPAQDHLEARLLMGAPKVQGEFTQTHGDLQINGHFVDAAIQNYTRENCDYFDLDVDTSFEGVPTDFGGVSGGGLWKVLIYCPPETCKPESIEILEGLAFWQTTTKSAHLNIRCHGPQTIRARADLSLKEAITRKIGECQAPNNPEYVLFLNSGPPVRLAAPAGTLCREIFWSDTPPKSIWLCENCVKKLGCRW